MERVSNKRRNSNQETNLQLTLVFNPHLNGENLYNSLSSKETMALQIVNQMPISLQDRKILFAAFVFFDAGIFRSRDLLGLSIDQTVAARDKVRTKKQYQDLWDDFEFIMTFQSQRDLIARRIEGKHPEFQQVLQMKRNSLTNNKIAETIGKPIKYVDSLTRALVFIQASPPNPSSVQRVNEQNHFLYKVIRLRSQGLSSQEIAIKLNTNEVKVEDATRFLVWTGIVDPISKSEGLLHRFNKVDYKEQVRLVINKIDLSELINLRETHRNSGLSIGYDKFLRLFHELEEETGQVPRYWRRPKKQLNYQNRYS